MRLTKKRHGPSSLTALAAALDMLLDGGFIAQTPGPEKAYELTKKGRGKAERLRELSKKP